MDISIFPIEQIISVNVDSSAKWMAILWLIGLFLIIPWLLMSFIFFCISFIGLNIRELIRQDNIYVYCHKRYSPPEAGEIVVLKTYPRLYFGQLKPQTKLGWLLDPLGSLFYFVNTYNPIFPWYSDKLLARELTTSLKDTQSIAIYYHFFSIAVTVKFYWREKIGNTLGDWEYKTAKLGKEKRDVDVPFNDSYRLTLKVD